MVIPARFERATPRLGIWCSILLSYGTTAVSSIQNRHGFAKPQLSLQSLPSLR